MTNPRAVTPKDALSRKKAAGGDVPSSAADGPKPKRKPGLPRGYKHLPHVKIRMSIAQRTYRARKHKAK